VQRYTFALGKALNLAMFYSFRGRNAQAKFESSRDQFIGYITLCKGVPFYGFHVGYRYFLKIHALQPRYMRRLTEVLKSGTVLPKFKPRKDFENSSVGLAPGCQVFEAHVPILLQFMLDFNLYGCNWIELAKCTFRTPLPC
jgi:DNA polymerase zeta